MVVAMHQGGVGVGRSSRKVVSGHRYLGLATPGEPPFGLRAGELGCGKGLGGGASIGRHGATATRKSVLCSRLLIGTKGPWVSAEPAQE